MILEEYIKYFAWKYEWRVDYRPPICKLCEMLNHGNEPNSIIDMEKVGIEAKCLNAQDLPYMVQR